MAARSGRSTLDRELRRSMTWPTMLFGVEAPAVRPTRADPWPAATPRDTRSWLAVVDGAPTGRWRIRRPRPGSRDRRCGRSGPARRRSGRGCRCCCCCSRRRRASGRAAVQSSSAITASCRSWVALQIVSNARKWRGSSASPYRSVIAARSISPISSDSDISMVVWFAQPMRSRSRSGSKPGETASPKRARNSASRRRRPRM